MDLIVRSWDVLQNALQKKRTTGRTWHHSFCQFLSCLLPETQKLSIRRKTNFLFSGFVRDGVEKLFEIIDNKESLAKRICSTNPQIFAEILLAVEAEYALTISDFMMRRVPLIFAPCQGLDCVETAAMFMGEILGWSPDRVDEEIVTYRREVDSKFRKTFNSPPN